MATYTPNLNLYMPDPTDDFGEFREKHNDNMVKIDNAIGGGGGSGGHTIIDPNGNSLPQESGLQFTGNVSVTDDSGNGKTVVDILGGGGNVYGAFIDTNRVLATYNSSGGSAILSYTALEDCFVAFYVFGKNSQTCRIYVDSAEILTVYFQGDGVQSPTLYLKKGQTLSFSSFDYWSFHYEVYGLTQGTNGIFTPIIYSDTERVVGVWRNNKPLYQRTYTNVNVTINSPNTWYDTGLLSGDIEEFIGGEMQDRYNLQYFPVAVAFGSSHTKILVSCPMGNREIENLTIRYTKSTDVAGSGNWNTDGVPTVHYSTSEQVIGTWIDGKPIYQRTWDFSGSPVMLTYGTWVDSGISAGENIKAIISAELKYGTVANMGVEVAVNADGYPVAFQKIENTGNTRGVSYCTLIYTKTTD